ncbi:BnaA05g35930D [Brassica napus]|uniref:BnaA05g35930D protein n=1 Tax=Brassica napus TaxID=3708 RepID=A0A078IWD6_BRANA|nr:BnaA05g35930D [Brassica napus]
MSLQSSSVRVNPSSSKVTSSTTLMLLSSATRTATGIFFASGSSLRCWSSWKPISFASVSFSQCLLGNWRFIGERNFCYLF